MSCSPPQSGHVSRVGSKQQVDDRLDLWTETETKEYICRGTKDLLNSTKTQQQRTRTTTKPKPCSLRISKEARELLCIELMLHM